MTKNTGNKWQTDCCGRCGHPHAGYSGKLDESGVEYVVCEVTNKRMDVGYMSADIRNNRAYPTVWRPTNEQP